jgi:hypothetical protein
LSRWRQVVCGIALSCVGVTTTACGGSNGGALAEPQATPPQITIPSRLLGLTVGTEDIKSQIEQADQPYVDSVGLFAFRESKDLLQATMQISRFTTGARPESTEFRGSIISRIGGTAPREVRVDDHEVFLTSGRNQVVFIWFERRGFFVLTIRRDYPFPRLLVRRLLQLDLEV